VSRYVGITTAQSAAILRGLVQRGVLEPLAPPPPVESPAPPPVESSNIEEACLHEAAHAVGVLLAGARITRVTVDDGGSGCCEGEPVAGLPLPKPHEHRAILHCACDLIGVVAVGFAFGFRIENDDDFRRHGGSNDLDNFYKCVALLRCNAGQRAALWRSALEMARSICRDYGEAIDEVTEDLRLYRQLDHAGVLRAIRRTSCADRLLSAQMPTLLHRAQTSPLRSVALAGGVLRECGPFSMVAIDRNGRRAHVRTVQEGYLFLTRG
jgi:hypothetical protein